MLTFVNKMAPKTVVLAIAATVLFIGGYLPVFRILVDKWLTFDEYSHAFLTLPVIAYMVWTKRHAIIGRPVRFPNLGLFLLAISTPVYMFALVTEVHTIISLSLLMTIIGSMIYIIGVDSVKDLFAPIVLLAMLIPIPEQLYTQLTFPLQLMVSQASEVFIRIAGIPILRQGNVMTIPGKSFEVVEACSGLRSMITLLTLSLILGYFMLSKNVSKLILIFASIPTAILVNIIRVVSLIVLFHFFKLDFTAGTSHTIMGLVIFAIALSILLLLQWTLGLWETKSK